MYIKEYMPEYREAMEKVCLSTASEKARTDKKHGQFSLSMYCDEYLDRELAYMLMNEDDTPVGYILCAKDAEQWAVHMEPYLEKIKDLSEEYYEGAVAQIGFYKSFQEEYPAHMHIDIMEEYTHGGNGTKLFEALLERLKKDQVKGLILGVAKSNERAVSFYKKMGFQIIKDQEYGYNMAMTL